MVALLDAVKLKNVDDLPDSPLPYFVIAQEGVYLRKKTAIGVSVLRQNKLHNSFGSMGDSKNGFFLFTGPKIPGETIALAYKFFQQVFKKRHSEAEVFILRNGKNEHQLFVPYQLATSGGVDSIYDEAHIPDGYQIIGTIHSHCDFDAFHSATDTGDASDFNGIHFTIGHVDSDEPNFVAMVMDNKEQFDYDLERVTTLTTDDLKVDRKIPEHWFNRFYETAEALFKDVDFPTLSEAEKEEFKKQTRPFIYTTSSGKGGGNTVPNYSQYIFDDDDWEMDRDWFGWGKKDNKLSSDKAKEFASYFNTKWSADFRKSFPAEWFVPGTTKLTEVGCESALINELEKLFEIAGKYGIYLEYDIKNLYEEANT